MADTHVAPPVVGVDYYNLTSKFFEASELLCRVHWHYASEAKQDQYRHYELDDYTYGVTTKEWNDRDDTDELFPWVAGVVSDVTGYVWSGSDVTNKRKTGRILKATSFARVLLGAPASPGDVECFLNYLDTSFPSTTVSLADLAIEYLRGTRGPLLAYLNGLLADASDAYRKLADAYDMQVPHLIPFRPGEKAGSVIVDMNFVRSLFPSLVSILRYLEGEGGSS